MISYLVIFEPEGQFVKAYVPDMPGISQRARGYTETKRLITIAMQDYAKAAVAADRKMPISEAYAKRFTLKGVK